MFNGNSVWGVGITISGATGQNESDSSDASSSLTVLFPPEVQDNWWFEGVGNNELVFQFSGLDDGLVYSLTIGTYRIQNTNAQHEMAVLAGV